MSVGGHSENRDTLQGRRYSAFPEESDCSNAPIDVLQQHQATAQTRLLHTFKEMHQLQKQQQQQLLFRQLREHHQLQAWEEGEEDELQMLIAAQHLTQGNRGLKPGSGSRISVMTPPLVPGSQVQKDKLHMNQPNGAGISMDSGLASSLQDTLKSQSSLPKPVMYVDPAKSVNPHDEDKYTDSELFSNPGACDDQLDILGADNPNPGPDWMSDNSDSYNPPKLPPPRPIRGGRNGSVNDQLAGLEHLLNTAPVGLLQQVLNLLPVKSQVETEPDYTDEIELSASPTLPQPGQQPRARKLHFQQPLPAAATQPPTESMSLYHQQLLQKFTQRQRHEKNQNGSLRHMMSDRDEDPGYAPRAYALSDVNMSNRHMWPGDLSHDEDGSDDQEEQEDEDEEDDDYDNHNLTAKEVLNLLPVKSQVETEPDYTDEIELSASPTLPQPGQQPRARKLHFQQPLPAAATQPPTESMSLYHQQLLQKFTQRQRHEENQNGSLRHMMSDRDEDPGYAPRAYALSDADMSNRHMWPGDLSHDEDGSDDQDNQNLTAKEVLNLLPVKSQVETEPDYTDEIELSASPTLPQPGQQPRAKKLHFQQPLPAAATQPPTESMSLYHQQLLQKFTQRQRHEENQNGSLRHMMSDRDEDPGYAPRAYALSDVNMSNRHMWPGDLSHDEDGSDDQDNQNLTAKEIQNMSRDDRPIHGLGGKKSFEQLLEEQLRAEEKKLQDEEGINKPNAKPFLKKGEGLSMFNCAPKKPQKKVSRKQDNKTSAPQAGGRGRNATRDKNKQDGIQVSHTADMNKKPPIGRVNRDKTSASVAKPVERKIKHTVKFSNSSSQEAAAPDRPAAKLALIHNTAQKRIEEQRSQQKESSSYRTDKDSIVCFNRGRNDETSRSPSQESKSDRSEDRDSVSLIITRQTNDWPLPGCYDTNIDLIFVADAATSTPSSARDTHYNKQMQFFSKLVDVFSPPSESNLTRLRVSLLASSVDNSSTAPVIHTRIHFDAYTQQADLKRAIEMDTLTTSPISYPLTVALSIIGDLYNETLGWAREDAEQMMIIVVDGGRPFQITKMDSELLVIFNTTKVRIAFILIGYESGINLQTVFPQNNYIKVQSYEVLNHMQSIPVNLCAFCYADWFKSEFVEHEIAATRVSCYRLFMEDDDLNWLESNEKCNTWSSELVSIESEKELSFLKSVLPEMIQSRLNTTNETSDYVNVYIGLTRAKSLGQRFRWMNNMPLILTHWGEGQPNSGSIEGCVVWNFSTNVFQEMDGRAAAISGTHPSINVGYSLKVDNFWSSVGCGFNNGRFYLCESENKLLSHVATLKSFSIEAPNSTSIEAAVSRGELAIHKGHNSYVSISALQLTKDSFMNYYSVFVQHKMNNAMSLASLKLYECVDEGVTLIPYALVCDFKRNCLNTNDESLCRFRECDSMMEVKCTSGQCVEASSWCDLYPDCLDGSDEADCTSCQHGRCPDGRCAPYHWFGDGEVDCSSCTNQGSIVAEMAAVNVKDIDQCAFTCNRTQCVYKSMLNDGFVDCKGPEGPLDETIGSLKSASCYSELERPYAEYTNWAPKCVYMKDRYGEPIGCRNMKHLHDCEHHVCPEGYIKCPHSYCIPVHYFQNKEYDCPRGEDELDVLINCPGYFICASSNICLHPDHVCDDFLHCPEGDDELNCLVTCRSGFQCLGGAVTVDGYDTSIPLTDFRFVDSRTRYLDVSGVNISAVFPSFPRGHFYNLLKAIFSGCSITHIDATPSSQNQLRSMLWIDLSYNFIQSVSVTSIFRYMIGLRTVNLSYNPYLVYMHNDAFSTYSTTSAIFVPLNNLERLFLRNTPLSEIRGDMFPAGFVLQQLDLRGVVVQHLYANMFTNVIIEQSLFTDTFKLCCPQLHNKNTPSGSCKAPRDPFSSCADLISEQILRILLWVNGFLALLGNISVIIYRLLFEKKILRMAYGHFVTHLSFSDLLMGVYLIIIAAADTYYRGSYVWDELQWRSSAACKVSGFLSTLSNETSTIFITLITLDRFLVIRFPFGQLRISGKLINILCVLSWALGFLIATVPLLPPFEHWTIYNSNGMCLGLPLTNRRQPGWQFSTAIFIFLNFFLFMFIAIGQVVIYRTMSETRINKANITNASSRRAQDLAIAKHLSLIAITDFLCWCPVGVIGLLALDGHEISMEAYAWLAVLVLTVNSALNPLLYTIPAVMKKWRLFKADTSCYVTPNS